MLINLAGAAIRIIFVFRRNPPHWHSSAYLWGMLGQPDPDLCARIFPVYIMHLNYVPEK